MRRAIIICPLEEGNAMLKIGVLLGDDIGLEVVPEAVKAMKAAAKKTGLEIEWQDLPIGRAGHEQHGHTMPEYTVKDLEFYECACGSPTCRGTIVDVPKHKAHLLEELKRRKRGNASP